MRVIRIVRATIEYAEVVEAKDIKDGIPVEMNSNPRRVAIAGSESEFVVQDWRALSPLEETLFKAPQGNTRGREA